MVPREKLLAAEGLAALACLALLGLGALVYALEPVGGAPQGTGSQAPWIFVGLQQLLAWMPSWLAGLVATRPGLGSVGGPALDRPQGRLSAGRLAGRCGSGRLAGAHRPGPVGLSRATARPGP